MQFIIHNTDTYNKPEFIELRKRAGLSGYGAWWALLELVAGGVDEETPPEIRVSTEILAERFGKQCRTIPGMLADFVECGLIELRTDNRIFSKHSQNILAEIENELKIKPILHYYISITNFNKYKGKYKCYKINGSGEYNKNRKEKKESFFSSRSEEEKKDSNFPYSPLRDDHAGVGPAPGGAPPPHSSPKGCNEPNQSDTRVSFEAETAALAEYVKIRALRRKKDGWTPGEIRQWVNDTFLTKHLLGAKECQEIMDAVLTPREKGTNPRALGTNPRAQGAKSRPFSNS